MELQNIGAFVDTFLDGEKEGARQLIRHEMESMIDPLVESLFGQLKVKLVDYVDAAKGLHGGHQHQHDQESVDLMVQDHEMIVNAQQYQSQSMDNAHSIDANYQINSTNHLEPMVIKEEFNDPANVQLEPQQNDHSINSSSSSHESYLFTQSMTPSTSTDESLANTDTMQPQNQQQLVNIKHNQFDEKECECDECVYGGFEAKEEEDDDDVSVEWIDDVQEDEESSRSVKRPRMDPTIPNNVQIEVTRQSTRQSTDEPQANEVNDSVHKQNDQMENLGIENEFFLMSIPRILIIVSLDHDTQSTIDHYDHGEHNFDESLAIQQNQNDANNTIAGEIVDESITNPTQPNLAQPNRRFQCPHCSKSFTSRSNLEQHVRVHTGERPFACDQCDKCFNQMSNLTQHQRIHRNIRRFHCDQCDKQFVLKNQLAIHLRTHSGERPYKCNFCDKSFTESSHRKSHEQAKHLHVKPYRCKVCGLTATQHYDIIKHIRIIHFGLPATIKEQRERNIIDDRDPKELVEKVLVL